MLNKKKKKNKEKTKLHGTEFKSAALLEVLLT